MNNRNRFIDYDYMMRMAQTETSRSLHEEIMSDPRLRGLQNVWALLKTRCGCSQPIMVSFPPPDIYRRNIISKSLTIRESFVSEDSGDTMLYEIREFKLTGRELYRGTVPILIYEEIEKRSNNECYNRVP